MSPGDHRREEQRQRAAAEVVEGRDERRMLAVAVAGLIVLGILLVGVVVVRDQVARRKATAAARPDAMTSPGATEDRELDRALPDAGALVIDGGDRFEEDGPTAEPEGDVAETASAVSEPRAKRRSRPRRARRAKRRRSGSSRPPSVEARDPAPTRRLVVTFRTVDDRSRSGVPGLGRTLQKSLERRLKPRPSVDLRSNARPGGLVLDAWIQSVTVSRRDGTNFVELACSSTLSDAGGGVRFNTRAKAGVGVVEALDRQLKREIIEDALKTCSRSMAGDLGGYIERRARRGD